MKKLSKYTTEVRFICETESGRSESVGFNNINQVLDLSWNKIFTTKCTFFNEEYRKHLCIKILKHYYTREISAETVGLWKLWMNRKLEEIMPYYNQLYESELIDFEPLDDTNMTRLINEITGTDNTENRNSTENRTNNTTTNTDSNTSATGSIKDTSETESDETVGFTEEYSDTPQGSLSGVTNMNYLTNATKRDTDTNTSQNGTYNRNTTDNTDFTDKTTSDTTEKTTNEQINTSKEDKKRTLEETLTGKSSGSSFASVLKEYRDTFLNIDMMVIEEFKDCFMNLW